MSASLFDEWPEEPADDVDAGAEPPKLTNREKFEQFHRDNPRVYAWLVEWARAYKADGVRRMGINLGIATLRWDRSFRTSTGEAFKINENHSAFYARLIMANEPDLAGFFEVRAQRAL